MESMKDFVSKDENGERPDLMVCTSGKSATEIDQRVMIGYTPVVLEKLFGPLIFMSLRIRPHAETCEWIIERSNKDGWQEFCRIPGQLDSDFEEIPE